jgi:sugar lactone lactonase YvrE
MLRKLHAAIRHDACFVHKELLSDETSIVSGDVNFFCARVSNTILIHLPNGTRTTYVMAEDVCLTATDNSDALPVRVHAHIRLDSKSGDIIITYTFEPDADTVPKELRVRVHVCGVLLVNACVRKAFSGRKNGRLQSQHEFELGTNSIAIYSAGTHLLISDYTENCVAVFSLPDFQFAHKLVAEIGDGPTELNYPRGLCITDANTLLIADYHNDRVQHWKLNGDSITSYSVKDPALVASHGNVVAIARSRSNGVHVISLQSGVSFSKWLYGSSVSAITFVNANTLAIAVCTTKTIGLYTLTGTLKKQLAIDIVSCGLAVCADDCMLVSDWEQNRVRVFSMDGVEIVSSSFAAHPFEGNISTIVVHAEHAYILEEILGEIVSVTRICVFE